MNCTELDSVRDYALGELDAAGRSAVEHHLPECASCRLELERMQVTTAALRVLPDVEIPQRIAFVSDKVFEPSPWKRWFTAARLGFASAVVMAAALVAVVYRQPAAVPMTVAQNGGVSQDVIARQIDDAVKKAVAQVREEDMQVTRTALEAAEKKHEAEHRALLAAVSESIDVLERRYSTVTSLTALGGEQ
jgi:anti-sigma factor RsiW